MIDREKVIKGLKCCVKWMKENDEDACNSCPYHSCDANSCIAMVNSEAIALLKEQEPKLVKIDADGDDVLCPSCGNRLFPYPLQKYCEECGQAVRWE